MPSFVRAALLLTVGTLLGGLAGCADFRASSHPEWPRPVPGMRPKRAPTARIRVEPITDLRPRGPDSGTTLLAWLPLVPFATETLHRPEDVLAIEQGTTRYGFRPALDLPDGLVSELRASGRFRAVEGPEGSACELSLDTELLETHVEVTQITYGLFLGAPVAWLFAAPYASYEVRVRARFTLREHTGHPRMTYDLDERWEDLEGLYYGRSPDVTTDVVDLLRRGLGGLLAALPSA